MSSAISWSLAQRRSRPVTSCAVEVPTRTSSGSPSRAAGGAVSDVRAGSSRGGGSDQTAISIPRSSGRSKAASAEPCVSFPSVKSTMRRNGPLPAGGSSAAAKRRAASKSVPSPPSGARHSLCSRCLPSGSSTRAALSKVTMAAKSSGPAVPSAPSTQLRVAAWMSLGILADWSIMNTVAALWGGAGSLRPATARISSRITSSRGTSGVQRSTRPMVCPLRRAGRRRSSQTNSGTTAISPSHWGCVKGSSTVIPPPFHGEQA